MSRLAQNRFHVESEFELETAGRLLRQLEAADYTGLDPSIVKFHPRLAAFRNLLSTGRAGRAWQWAAGKAIECLGHRLHGFLDLEPARLPKCLALSALAFLSLHRRTGEPGFLPKALRLIEDLKKMSLEGGNLWSHGAPYRMRRETVSAATPNVVTTFFVSQAILEASVIAEKPDLTALFKSVVERAFSCFPARHTPRGDCFMYTPDTSYYVHNANLMIVHMAAQYWQCGGGAIPESPIGSALTYSLGDFLEKKALPYAGPPTPNAKEDNYHTGYVLRSLKAIRRASALDPFRADLDRVLSFGIRRYWDQFCKNGLVVRDRSGKINAHSLAEALSMKKTCGWPPGFDAKIAEDAIGHTLKRLWNVREERFDDQVFWLCGIPFRNKADYPRWSQAWMAYALARPADSAEPL